MMRSSEVAMIGSGGVGRFVIHWEQVDYPERRMRIYGQQRAKLTQTYLSMKQRGYRCQLPIVRWSAMVYRSWHTPFLAGRRMAAANKHLAGRR